MNRKLTLVIESGEKTCASEPGKFCKYVGTVRFGQTHVCRLFPLVDRAYTALKEKEGWLQRLPECLEAEKKSVVRGKPQAKAG